jgi:hypothetical protein
MKKSDTFLNLVVWVIAGAVFATGAVLLTPRGDLNRDKTSVVHQEAPIALEQR